MPRFVRDSLRARILMGISIMLLPLLGVAAGALLGIHSVNASFREVVQEVIEGTEPIIHLQIAIPAAAMPANDYLIHGESAERDKFARLSEKVERAFKRAEAGSLTATEDPALVGTLIGSAYEAWRQVLSISERLLALPRPVGDTAAAREMKRMDEHVDRAVELLERAHELIHGNIEREFAVATATEQAVLLLVVGVSVFGFAVAVSAGGALAWSILASVRALSEGARAFSEGNLSRRVQLEGHDELGRLASVFNAMAAELEKSHRALKEVSIRDPLTGLYNRREFDRRLGEELRRCDRYRHSLYLFMLDLDHFKAINDAYGHPVGDMVLREVGRIVEHAVRATDEVARYGGEEFAVILPETDKLGASVLAERIRAAVAAYTFSVDETRSFSVTVSIGLAGFPDGANSGESLVAAADSALYDAKRTGRNCVCSFSARPSMEDH